MPALGLRGRPGILAPRSLAGRPGSAPQRGTNPPRVLSDEPQAFCQGRAQHTGRVPRRISEGGRDETPPTPAATLPHRGSACGRWSQTGRVHVLPRPPVSCVASGCLSVSLFLSVNGTMVVPMSWVVCF